MRRKDRAMLAIPLMALCAFPGALFPQSTATIDVPLNALGASGPQSCRSTFISRYRTTADTPASDTLFIRLFKDAQFTERSNVSLPIDVRINDIKTMTISPGQTGDSAMPGAYALAERSVSISLPNSTVPVCTVATPRGSIPPSEPESTHTDFIASGEVSNALRTGSANNDATGSLGIHHVSYAEPGQSSVHFPFWFRKSPWRLIPDLPVDVEELLATISVASTADTLTGPAGAAFSQAVLLPLGAAHGLGSSVQLEYSPLSEYNTRRHQQIGLLLRFVGARSSWAPDTGTATRKPGPQLTTVILAFDARVKWVVINKRRDENGNNFQFALDFGYIQRTLAGDAADSTQTFIKRALGQPRTRFTGYATGIYLTLRQVTAYADFACLSCKSPIPFLHWRSTQADRIPSLEGLQPIIGFRYEAPFFSLR